MNRRAALAIGLAAVLPGCAGSRGAGGQPGTAVIGLRIEDNAALRQVRASYDTPLPIFAALHSDASATLKFGRVDPQTGGIDLPFLAGLFTESVLLSTSGYQTSYKAARLDAGRYVTMQATFLEQPSSKYRLVRILEFSGGNPSSAAPGQLGGYAFDVSPGQVVYVGTMVLGLAHLGESRFKFAPPRIEDEFAAASAAHPALLQVPRAQATTLMARFVRGAGPATPVFPPPQDPAPGSAAPGGTTPSGLPPPSPVPAMPPPSGPPRVPRAG